jgi:hypothetical protein
MRLRKPLGAAQPGEVSLVLVAVYFWKRRRVTEPQGRVVLVCFSSHLQLLSQHRTGGGQINTLNAMLRS